MAGPGRKPTVPDSEILQVFIDKSDPVLTTTEVADEIGLGRRGTYNRLQQLAENGDLRLKKVGETGAVWWHPDHI